MQFVHLKEVKNTYHLALLLFCFTVFSCKQDKKTIVNANDYAIFFQKGKQNDYNAQKRVDLLNTMIKEDSMQIIEIKKISTAYSQLFEATGNIDYLKKSEQALLKTLHFGGLREDYILLDLTRNCISQHRFKEAKFYAIKAHNINPNKASKLVLFDVYLELGQMTKAFTFLNDKKIRNLKDFDYLIRLAKWNDYEGDMEAVLANMEAATSIAEHSKKQDLISWSYINLATYYGHAGKIKKSYDYFIKALELNETNAFAKKSIAWILYSYEKNPEQAYKILEKTILNYKSPDLYLFMAELSKEKKDSANVRYYNELFENTSSDARYGHMYYSLNALYLAENKKNYDKALQLLDVEVRERATPIIYGLYAYILNLKGNHKEALQIVKKHVLDKTYDPKTNYYVAEIYKSNDLIDEVKLMKKNLKESNFELGPKISQRVNNL